MALKVKKSKTFHVDEGEYSAIVSNIEEKEGQHGQYFVWTFLVKGATHDGEPIDSKKVKVTGLTSDTFSTKSKLYKWAKGVGLDVDSDELDLEDAIRSKCRVYIEDDEDKDGNVWSKIVKVRKAAKKAADDDEDEEEEKPKKKKEEKKSKKKKKEEVEEEDDWDDDDEDDDDEEDDDEEDEAPPKKKSKGKKKKEEEEDDDEDDDDLFDFDDD